MLRKIGTMALALSGVGLVVLSGVAFVGVAVASDGAADDDDAGRRKPVSYEVEVRELKEQPYVVQRGECKNEPAAVGAKLSELLPAVAGYLAAKGVDMVGPPFTRYLVMTDERIELEGGCPTAETIAVEGELRAGAHPAGPAAVTMHVGPYEKLGEAHDAVTEWAKANGREVAGPAWEVYWTDPGSEPDPAKWRTEVFLPLK